MLSGWIPNKPAYPKCSLSLILDYIAGLFSRNLESAGNCSSHGQNSALGACLGTPALCFANRMGSGGFLLLLGFLHFYNAPCRIDKEGYVRVPSESLPFLTALGLTVFFFSWEAQENTGVIENQRVNARVSYRLWGISFAVFRCSHLGNMNI